MVDTMGFRCKVLRAGGGRAVSVWALASLGPVVCDVTWKPWQWQGAEALLADLRRGKVCCLSILWERCVDLRSMKGHGPFFKQKFATVWQTVSLRPLAVCRSRHYGSAQAIIHQEVHGHCAKWPQSHDSAIVSTAILHQA